MTGCWDGALLSRGELGGRLAISVAGYSIAEARDPWDADWLSVTLEARAGGLSAKYPTSLRVRELEKLHTGLFTMYEQLIGQVRWQAPERQLELRVTASVRLLNGDAGPLPGVS